LGGSQTLKGSAAGTNTTGTIRVAAGRNLTLSAAGGVAFTAYAGGATAPLTVSGAGQLVMNGGPVSVTTPAPLAIGTYTLIDTNSGGTVTGTAGTLTLNGVSAPSYASVAVTGNQLVLTVTGSGGPTITGQTNFVNAFSTTYGTPSAAQTYPVTGVNLTSDITNAAAAGFEVSGNGGATYGTTAIVTNVGGSASGTVHIRLAATAPAGTYNSSNIVVLTSAGATSITNTSSASGNRVNTLPVANAKTYSVPQYGLITIGIGSGAKALATDADNDPLTFVSLGDTNAVDYGTAVINFGSTNFTYTSTNGSPGNQAVFSYIVTDGTAFATNLITIQIGSPVGANLVSATYSNSTGYLTFAGVPGTNYVLEHTATLSYPISWMPVQTNMANTNAPIGLIYFQQTLSPSNDYFRTRNLP
jgi:hypothetical protein